MQLPLQNRIALGLIAIALIAGLSIAPTQRAQAATPTFDERIASQTMKVAPGVATQTVVRDGLAATDGVQTLANNGTNADWAKLVLLFGGWPQTDENVTLMLRWMRQENGPPDWWNRNNPLNNGYGSGGGAGLGSYPDLVSAARFCAENLHRGYPDIAAGLAASAPPTGRRRPSGRRRGPRATTATARTGARARSKSCKPPRTPGSEHAAC